MANMFLAGYFTSITVEKLCEEKWGLAAVYCGLAILNLVFALT